ncbi:MAG: SPOR domain-containing protein [Polaromonas sp.]|nr:SPOR domain-containing protein [Polaromonas sp.]
MLRVLVLLLTLANAGYWAWSQGLLAPYGWAPVSASEPQRLQQQLRPEALQLLDSGAAAPAEAPRSAASEPTPKLSPTSASASTATATECLQAGLFTDAQAQALRTGLKNLPAGSWALERKVTPGRWIVYMGPYASDDLLAKKRDELRRLGVRLEPLVNPALAPGLSLGHFSTRPEAEAELGRVAQRGVRTARVVAERPEASGQRLMLAAVDAPLRAQLDTLKPQLAGKALQACPST